MDDEARRSFRTFLGPKAPPEANVDRLTRSAKVFADPKRVEEWAPWGKLYDEPFQGMTSDGRLVSGLYRLAPNGAPTEEMVKAALDILPLFSAEELRQLHLPMSAREWRRWQNTPIYLPRDGSMLERMTIPQREAIMRLVKESLSASGYQLARDIMRLNAFCGELIGRPNYLNEWTFNFGLFGEPSLEEPWGWQLHGHHLALNCVVIGRQLVLSPIFLGSEPTYADHGPYAGIRVFEDHERLGLELMRSFSEVQQRQATLLPSLSVADMPPGRLHWADQHHLGGAFQDNRIVPYEGLSVRDFTRAQRRDLLRLVEQYISPLPEGPGRARMEEIERHLDATHFAWMGRVDDINPFYYRIHSPVTMIEFDHHSGIFLGNEEPERFHVHTIVRTPNGNDYGMDLLKQHYARDHAGEVPGGERQAAPSHSHGPHDHHHDCHDHARDHSHSHDYRHDDVGHTEEDHP